MNFCKIHNDIHEGAIQLMAEHRGYGGLSFERGTRRFAEGAVTQVAV